jgi:hypothetical protein
LNPRVRRPEAARRSVEGWGIANVATKAKSVVSKKWYPSQEMPTTRDTPKMEMSLGFDGTPRIHFLVT